MLRRRRGRSVRKVLRLMRCYTDISPEIPPFIIVWTPDRIEPDWWYSWWISSPAWWCEDIQREPGIIRERRLGYCLVMDWVLCICIARREVSMAVVKQWERRPAALEVTEDCKPLTRNAEWAKIGAIEVNRTATIRCDDGHLVMQCRWEREILTSLVFVFNPSQAGAWLSYSNHFSHLVHFTASASFQRGNLWSLEPEIWRLLRWIFSIQVFSFPRSH